VIVADFGCLVWDLFFLTCSQLPLQYFDYERTDEGYSRMASCALNFISTFLLQRWNLGWFYNDLINMHKTDLWKPLKTRYDYNLTIMKSPKPATDTIYPHIKFWWYRTMLNFYAPFLCRVLAAILKMADILKILKMQNCSSNGDLSLCQNLCLSLSS
jgi:hypothetical protein